MREHLLFLKVSSFVVKVFAWGFLCLGALSALLFLSGRLSREHLSVYAIGIVMYIFLFFFLYLVAKIADLLVKIINEIKKE